PRCGARPRRDARRPARDRRTRRRRRPSGRAARRPPRRGEHPHGARLRRVRHGTRARGAPLPRPRGARRDARGGVPRPHRDRFPRPCIHLRPEGRLMSTVTLVGAYAKANLLETVRIPIALIGTLVFPAMSLLFFVVPNRTVAEDALFATQAVISLGVFAV